MDEKIVEGHFDVEVLVAVILAAGIEGRAGPVVQDNSELTGVKYYEEVMNTQDNHCPNFEKFQFSKVSVSELQKFDMIAFRIPCHQTDHSYHESVQVIGQKVIDTRTIDLYQIQR